MTLARVLHLDKQIAPNPNDPALLKKLLDERVAFAIEGFKSGGVTLTRRDVLKLAAAHAPESFRDVMSLNTLPSLRGKIRPGSARLSRRKRTQRPRTHSCQMPATREIKLPLDTVIVVAVSWARL